MKKEGSNNMIKHLGKFNLKEGFMKKKGFVPAFALTLFIFVSLNIPVHVASAQGTAALMDWNDYRIMEVNSNSSDQNTGAADPKIIFAPLTMPQIDLEIVPKSIVIPAGKINGLENEAVFSAERSLKPLPIVSEAVNPSESKLRFVSPVPAEVPAKKAGEVNFTIQKLEILADALADGNIKGLAALHPDEFTSAFLLAASMELDEWIEDTRNDREFRNLFEGKGPWILIFLAMSPASMHECFDNLDFPGGGDVLESKRIPVDLRVTHEGSELKVELTAAYNIHFNIRITSQNEAEIDG